MPVAEFTRLSPIEVFKSFDGVSQVSVAVVGKILHRDRKKVAKQCFIYHYKSLNIAVVPNAANAML